MKKNSPVSRTIWYLVLRIVYWVLLAGYISGALFLSLSPLANYQHMTLDTVEYPFYGSLRVIVYLGIFSAVVFNPIFIVSGFIGEALPVSDQTRQSLSLWLSYTAICLVMYVTAYYVFRNRKDDLRSAIYFFLIINPITVTALSYGMSQIVAYANKANNPEYYQAVEAIQNNDIAFKLLEAKYVIDTSPVPNGLELRRYTFNLEIANIPEQLKYFSVKMDLVASENGIQQNVSSGDDVKVHMSNGLTFLNDTLIDSSDGKITFTVNRVIVVKKDTEKRLEIHPSIYMSLIKSRHGFGESRYLTTINKNFTAIKIKTD